MSGQEEFAKNLPVVGRDTIRAHDQNHTEFGGQEYATRINEKFVREQPHLMEAMTSVIMKAAASREEAGRMAAVVLTMYELLSLQAEADAMQKLFPFDENE